jgi:1,2-phenylacetyl-CoA epoxidase catalytic subunit
VVVSGHAREEREHFEAVAALWVDVTGAPRAGLEAWVERRLAHQPLPVPASWLELAMAQFLFDRAGQWQLREYRACSFTPYRDLVAGILDDERGHQDLGAEVVVSLCRGGGGGDRKNELFSRWLGPSLLSFGRPGGAGNRRAIALGLKTRDSAAVMQDFINDIKPAVRDAGLVFPAPASLGVETPETLDWRV